jgi:N-acyl-D-amino-acid deacylase
LSKEKGFARLPLASRCGKSPEDVAIDLVVEDGTRVGVANLSLKDRGRLMAGYFADIVVFDPEAMQDLATYDRPHQLSTGVRHVLVNGRFALKDRRPTGDATGRVVRGRAWTGAAGGGCRDSAGSWTWSR